VLSCTNDAARGDEEGCVVVLDEKTRGTVVIVSPRTAERTDDESLAGKKFGGH
jgi:hypothetical protein